MTGHQLDQDPTHRKRGAVWVAGLVVALGAGVATAHGLFEVALAAGVPAGMAWLYPLITDGLALVAYATTARLTDAGRRYAWAVVVVAAGLSGLAQAVYLAGAVEGTAPGVLKFGVGAWPAVAAAVVAHLLHLLGTATRTTDQTVPAREAEDRPGVTSSVHGGQQPVRRQAEPGQTRSVQPRPVHAVRPDPVQPASSDARTASAPGGAVRPSGPSPAGSAGDRARAAAAAHHARHGQFPTVTELMQAAGVARGTAGAVLKDLRGRRPALRAVDAPMSQQEETS